MAGIVWTDAGEKSSSVPLVPSAGADQHEGESGLVGRI
nr:hypothetical protein [Salmonella bongori]